MTCVASRKLVWEIFGVGKSELCCSAGDVCQFESSAPFNCHDFENLFHSGPLSMMHGNCPQQVA